MCTDVENMNIEAILAATTEHYWKKFRPVFQPLVQ